ncbi:hypothetical protein [Nonomuraea sp. NPDC052265]|uniref:hypothetical protein n=1 Tax=Nonomuraea sp. NPDC052265 TaxID=3364374 RepID=UPI0037C8B5F5
MPDHDDIDPTAARTVEEFALCLRQLRTRAGNPSLRDLEKWARRYNKQLPRSSVCDALAGKWLPRRQLVLTFLQACGVDPAADPRWVRAWIRLTEQVGPHEVGPSPQAAATVGSAEVHALMEAKRLLAEAAQARRAADLEIKQSKAAAQRDIDRKLAQAEQAMQHARLSAQLARDIRTTGLRRIGATYLSDLEWNALFASVTELDIFMAYGQTWRNLHARQLALLAARRDSRIRVFLADPDDQTSIDTLATRFVLTVHELRERIEATRRDYAALRQPGGADIQIHYWPGDRTFSFFRLDQTAVVGFYSHSRSRASAVPLFVCEAPGELYQFVLDELNAIQQSSRPA